MSRVKVIVNPHAGHGYGERVSAEIDQCMRGLGLDFEMVHTSHPGHAVLLAQEAHRSGFDVVVAVGGDGTTNEVVNGLMACANGDPVGTLACMPAGSGNDFAFSAHMPTNIAQACEAIAQGQSQIVDVGRVTFDQKKTLFFDNTLGIGFDSLVAKETLLNTKARGMALYVPAVLKTIFFRMQILDVTLTIDGQEQDARALMLTTSNGKREGATFLTAPNASVGDGLLELLIVEQMSRLAMLAVLPRFIKGTHLSHPRISEQQVRHVKITSAQTLDVHMDGEIPVASAHEIDIQVVPGALRVITGA